VIQVQFEGSGEYLTARLSGAHALPDALAAFQKIAVAAREQKAQRLLLDMVGISGEMPDMDRYELGKEGAEIFCQIDRVGILYSTSFRYTGFGVDVANNRGLNVRGFQDPVAAADWLKSS
jgi:hypothetical protein